MESIIKLLIRKKHPEYTEEEVWEDTWKFCEGNQQKIQSFLNRYSYASVTEPFDRLRKQTMSVIHNSDNYEMQRMLRDITNFETGMLFLLADEAARERLTRNLTKRLEIIIGGEAYIAARKLSPGEKEFATVLGKVMRVFFSEDMLEFKRERWECRHSFHVDQSWPLEKKKRILAENLSMCNIACWSKAYEPLQAWVEEYLCHEYEFEKRREIADLMYDGLYEKGLQTAYDFSKSGKGRVSIMFSGLCFGEKEEIVYLSYLIRDDGRKKTIYRFTHELSTFPELDDVKLDECYRTLEMLMKLLLTGKKEGLLAMEDMAFELPEDGVDGLFRKGIIYTVDGHDPLEVERFLSNEIVLMGAESFDGYLRYLFMRGILAVQQGYSECLFYREMLSYLPLFMREEGEKRMRETERQFLAQIRKKRMEKLDRHYPRSTQSPYFPIIAEKLSTLSDEELRELMFAVSLEEDLVLFSYVPAELRTRMFRLAPEATVETFLEEPHYFMQEEQDQAWLKVVTVLNEITTK